MWEISYFIDFSCAVVGNFVKKIKFNPPERDLLRHFVPRKLSNVMLWKSGRILKTGIQCMATVEEGCYCSIIGFSSIEEILTRGKILKILSLVRIEPRDNLYKFYLSCARDDFILVLTLVYAWFPLNKFCILFLF